MTNFNYKIGDFEFIVEDGEVYISDDGYYEDLGVEEIFKLSEFLGLAYETLTGAEYVHMEYERGNLVVREGVPAASVYDDGNGIERDCE